VVETQFHPLETILQRYEDQTWPFAGESARILRRLRSDAALLQTVQSLIATICC
jgi:hypothetical protein